MKTKIIISILTACSFVSMAQAVDRSRLILPTNDFVHFSFPLKADSEPQSVHQESNISSDEYWFQTSGKALNNGVLINSTQAGALIRVTQGHGSKGKQLAPDLDTSLLKLNSTKGTKQSVIDKVISKKLMEETDVFDNTLVIKTKSNVGALMLKTSQALNDDDLYMISVKEQNSPYRLQFTMDAQSYSENKNATATIQLVNGEQKLSTNKVTATLIAPDGQRSPVNFTAGKQGQVKLNLLRPKNVIAPINGLYEVLVEASGQENGLTIQRNAKLALTFTKDTARLAKVTLDNQASNAELSIVAKEGSRFEARAILYGTNYDGKLVPVMETHAAQSFNPGINLLRLPFDTKILNEAQVGAPFELRNVRLFDQKQLALIDTITPSTTTN